MSTSDTTLRSLMSDFFSNLFSLEKSIFAAMIKIISNPKELVINYWRGHRKYYPSPGKLLVYALAIAALHMTYVNGELLGLSFDLQGGGGQFLFWSIFFPFLTFTSYICFFRKKMNLAKHVVSIGYIASCFFIILTVMHDLFIYFGMVPTDSESLAFFIFLFLVFIWNGRVYTSNPNVIKVVLSFFLQLLVFCLLIGMVLGIISVIDPDRITF